MHNPIISLTLTVTCVNLYIVHFGCSYIEKMLNILLSYLLSVYDKSCTPEVEATRGETRVLIGGGGIFMYLCSA